MLLGLVGKKGSGKDTCADYLTEHHKFIKIALADPPKHAVRKLFRLTPKQLWGPIELKEAIDERYQRSPRELVIELSNFGKSIDPDCWIKLALSNIGLYEKVVVSDVRFLNEAAAIKRNGGILCRIQRNFSTGLGEQDPSETEQEQIQVDWEIQNTGTLEELYEKIEFIMARV